MRPLLTVACLALLTATLAGCTSEDPLRYPDGASSTPSSSAATSSSTAPKSSTTTTSSSGTTSVGTPSTNLAPSANLTVTPANGIAPLAVTFTANGTDDGDDLSWILDFGDGNKTNGTTLPATVEHTYTNARNYTASLTVSDGALNRTATAHVAAEGESAPAAPTIEELCPTDPLAVGHEMVGYYTTPADNLEAPGSLWIYEESNDMPGLQRNDDTMPTSCPTPDTIVF